MNIGAIGSQERLEELDLVLSSAGLSFKRLESTKNIQNEVYDVIFDLNFDDNPSSITDYANVPAACRLFLSSVKIQLEAAVPRKMWQQVLGINAMPTFLKRKALEYCTLIADFEDVTVLSLGWEQANRTESRVGLVSPRIILMIINEAYYTLQEGTAGRDDIDKGMKLGTAYPMGPFEWCGKIGIKDVYETLNALFDDTQDERYRICSLLKTEYLRHQAE
jgi:3-hydroxybutyryl-CoA dehydrogenase